MSHFVQPADRKNRHPADSDIKLRTAEESLQRFTGKTRPRSSREQEIPLELRQSFMLNMKDIYRSASAWCWCTATPTNKQNAVKQKYWENSLHLVLHQSERHTQVPVAECFVLALATTVSLSLSLCHTHTHTHTHCQKHIATKQWQTVGHTLALPACRVAHVFKFLSRACRLPALFGRASFGHDSQTRSQSTVTETRRCSEKLTDSTDGPNMRQALIKDSNSALGGSDTGAE